MKKKIIITIQLPLALPPPKKREKYEERLKPAKETEKAKKRVGNSRNL